MSPKDLTQFGILGVEVTCDPYGTKVLLNHFAHLYPGSIDSEIISGYYLTMNEVLLKPSIAFSGHRRLASGPLHEVAIAVKNATDTGVDPIFIYDDSTGRVIDLDPRGTQDEVLERLLERIAPAPAEPAPAEELRGRGRPKLGVIAREVTLLPRHWDWLSTQPGGASVALRKLVEQARKTSGDSDRRRMAQEAAYRFMSFIAGDLPGFQEAARALFAYDRRRFGELVADWPEDVRDHVIKLAFSDLEPAP
jgi:hypothetical protein